MLMGWWFPENILQTWLVPDFVPEVVKMAICIKAIPPRIAEYRYRPACTFGVIYMYLLLAHYQEEKIHDIDDEVRDEALSMGERELFIEHPTDEAMQLN
jgi:hypothetical protein